MKRCCITVLLFASVLFAQVAPKAVTDETTAYLLPDSLKLDIRSAQLEWDEVEIDTQKMQVKIEQNKARQKQLEDENRLRALQFARDKGIDLQLWILDAKELKFVKKGKK